MGKKENKTIIILNLFQVKITQDYMGLLDTFRPMKDEPIYFITFPDLGNKM